MAAVGRGVCVWGGVAHIHIGMSIANSGEQNLFLEGIFLWDILFGNRFF